VESRVIAMGLREDRDGNVQRGHFAVSGATNLAVNRSKHERRALYQRVWVRIV
jgi:hypothetical protein